MSILVDVSAYQCDDNIVSTVNFAELKAHGVDGAIIKIDNGAPSHFIRARAANMYTGAYLWEDPTVALSYKMNMLTRFVDYWNPDFLATDIEQYWKVWAEYWQLLSGKLPANKLTLVPGDAISKSAKATVDAAIAKYPNKRQLAYTARWFTDEHSPQMSKWLGDYETWIAWYIDRGKTNYKVTWDQFHALVPTVPPGVPAGVTKATLHQYSSRMILPCGGPYDLSVGPDLKSWLGELKKAPGPLYTVETTATPNLRVRNKPSLLGDVVDKLLPGTQKPIYEEKDGSGKN